MMNADIENKIKECENVLFSYVVQYNNGSLDMDGIKDFCAKMLEYCKMTKHNDSVLEIPKLEFTNVSIKEYNGAYICDDNLIRINENYLRKILANQNKKHPLSTEEIAQHILNDTDLCFLVNTIAHEMKHFQQMCEKIEYNNLTIEQQRNVDRYTKKTISNFQNDFSLNEYTIELVHMLADPEGYELIHQTVDFNEREAYYKHIEAASYYTLLKEKEARDEGADFAKRFYVKLYQSGCGISREAFDDIHTIMSCHNDHDHEVYEKCKIQFDAFNARLDLNEEKILNIAERVESQNARLIALPTTDYLLSIQYMIASQTFEQKKIILEQAIKSDYSLLTRVIIDSMHNDIDFKENQQEASKILRDCLISKDKGELGSDLSNKLTQNISCSTILTQTDLEILIKQLIKNDSLNAYNIIKESGFLACSTEILLELQRHMFYSDYDYVENEIFTTLISKASIQENIKYLETGKLKPTATQLLIEHLKQHPEYENHKNEIDSIITANATKKYEEIIPNDFRSQVEHKLRTCRAEVELYGSIEKINIDKCISQYASLNKPIQEIFEIIDEEYAELKNSLIYASNFAHGEANCSIIEGSNNLSLSGIIGGFHLTKNELCLQSLFKNDEEGRLNLREIRSQNWPKNKTELPIEEQKEIERDAKNEYEIPAMKDSIAELLPHLEKLTHIKNISIESNNAFMNYIQSAIEDLGFKEVYRTKKELRDIEIFHPGATAQNGNKCRYFSVSRECLIENIKAYLLTKKDNPTTEID